ncbi:MAG: DUF4139 domain-containing protein [Burkholderiales bacterium]|nr:DUF4139 domain-containing protein [Burkholderiales bacterium]
MFDTVPAGLSDKPALSTVVDVAAPTQATLTLSYLAIGVNWQADYVARIHPNGRTLDLTGWLTLVNASGTSFADAPTQAVAGRLSRVEVDVKRGEARPIARDCWPMDTTHLGRRLVHPEPPPAPPMMMMAPAPMMAGGLEEVVVTGQRKLAEQSDLGDYKLYTLPEPVTVAARQTKQVAFLDQRDVAFQRLYVVQLWSDFEHADAPLAATVVLRLDNKPADGLGKPLPSGALAVFETAGGRPAFAGEQAMRDVPVGQPFDLAIGEAMDVRVRPRLIAEQDRRPDRVRRVYEVDLANAKTVPIVAEVRMATNRQGFKIVAEPTAHDIRDAAAAWRVTLPANGRKTLRLAVEYDD